MKRTRLAILTIVLSLLLIVIPVTVSANEDATADSCCDVCPSTTPGHRIVEPHESWHTPIVYEEMSPFDDEWETHHFWYCDYGPNLCEYYSTSFSRIMPHSITYEVIAGNSVYHAKKCTDCTFYVANETDTPHVMGSWRNYNNATYHRRKCNDCTRYEYAKHNLIYYQGSLVCQTSGCTYSRPYGNQ